MYRTRRDSRPYLKYFDKLGMTFFFSKLLVQGKLLTPYTDLTWKEHGLRYYFQKLSRNHDNHSCGNPPFR